MPKSSRSEMDAFRAVVLERDACTCQMCGENVMHKLASIQHRRPRGMGGSALVNIPSNGVLVCGSATTPDSCHNEIEHVDRTKAQEFGYLIPKLSGIHPSTVPLWTFTRGWILLDDLGGWIPMVGEVPA